VHPVCTLCAPCAWNRPANTTPEDAKFGKYGLTTSEMNHLHAANEVDKRLYAKFCNPHLYSVSKGRCSEHGTTVRAQR
jgi:hypothetical protein